MKLSLIISLGFALLTSCTAPQNSSLTLVGGEPVPDDLFKSVVLLNNCTATKIGSHFFLLAAHCVVDTNQNTIPDSLFATKGMYNAKGHNSNRQINIDTNNLHAEGVWSHPNLTILETHVHPSYRYGWQQLDQKSSEDKVKHQLAADVAVIEIKEETPDIPIMKLNTKFAKTASYKVGYGCESEHIRERFNCRPFDKDRQFKYGLADTPLDPMPLLEKLPEWAPERIRDQTTLHYLISKARFHSGPPTAENQSDYNEGDLPGDDRVAGLGESDSGGPLILKNGEEYLVTGVNSKKAIWLNQEHDTVIEGAAFDAHARIHKGAPLFVGEWLEDIVSRSPSRLFPVPDNFLYYEPIALDSFRNLEIGGQWQLDLSQRRTTREYLRHPTGVLDIYIFSKDGSCPLTPSYLYIEDVENGDDAEVTSASVSETSSSRYQFNLESKIDSISSIAFGFRKTTKFNNDLKFCYMFISAQAQ